MKLAFAGKGGTGKTTVTTLFASYLARKSHILALDSESNENLAYSLGFGKEDVQRLEKIRHYTEDVYAHTKTDPNWETRHLTPHVDAKYYSFLNGRMDEFLKKITVTRGNISVAQLGTVDEDKRGIQDMCNSYTLMRVFLNHLNEGENDFILVDLTAGNELLTRATVINMDEIILVVEPTMKNLTVAKDILISLEKLSFDRVYVVVNKSFKASDREYVARELRIDPHFVVRLPFMQEIIELDNEGELTFDTAPSEIKEVIQNLLLDIQSHPVDHQKLRKRARELDARLFPNEHLSSMHNEHPTNL